MASADRAHLLDELRPRAFEIAYRMLGSVTDAEDVVQEALLRLHGVLAGGGDIDAPAFLVLLEKLSPEQRAVFLLRDVFDYDYESIADIVGKSQAACRQLAVRARQRIAHDRPQVQASRKEQATLARMFMVAARTGNLQGLEALLAQDVSLHGDGGGKAQALTQPVFGRERVARTLLSWMNVVMSDESVVHAVEVNGQPGALMLGSEGRVRYVLSLDIAEGQIQGIRSIANPDKLRHLSGSVEV